MINKYKINTCKKLKKIIKIMMMIIIIIKKLLKNVIYKIP